MSVTIPRPEYPRPQFVRDGWMNLNGTWEFEIDHGVTGRSRGLVEKEHLDGSIIVPFCPESKLSGVGYTDFMLAVWYKRAFTLPAEAIGKRVFMNFGAVDYRTEVWINGKSVGTHEGGYTSFSFEITDALINGENTVVICAEDNTRSALQPTGKQSSRYESFGCVYTRTTGIWQTVWLEWTEEASLTHIHITPAAEDGSVHVSAKLRGTLVNGTVTVETSYNGRPTGTTEVRVSGGCVSATVKLTEVELWNVGDGKLYDMKLTLARDGKIYDTVKSYFGLRSIEFDGMRFLLNGKSVFQRLILDQGFYPGGIYTAPTDDDLKKDIELSMAMGFNGARLHQKVFEARYLYWADRLGYLCWGEMANWGLDISDIAVVNAFQKEWLEEVDRDYSSPAIIGWCPFNETWDSNGRRQDNDILRMIYRVTKALDRTRPCIDTSGNYHVLTDIHDVHDYEQDPEKFKACYGAGTKPIYERFPDRQTYMGQPVFVSEYGGIRWSDDKNGWGYGQGPQTEEEFLARYKGLTDVLLDNPDHFGLCYTQLTDVEQEQNGLYTYRREPKFDPATIHAITSRKAAIED